MTSDTEFDPSMWRRIDHYLERALDLEPTKRENWLIELAARQPVIADTLRELLAQRDVVESNGFLEGSLLSSGMHCVSAYATTFSNR